MSKAPMMIDCPKCDGKKEILLHYPVRRYPRAEWRAVWDICDMCGGSGRIAAVRFDMGKVDAGIRKRQRYSMTEWLAMEKALIYGDGN